MAIKQIWVLAKIFMLCLRGIKFARWSLSDHVGCGVITLKLKGLGPSPIPGQTALPFMNSYFGVPGNISLESTLSATRKSFKQLG